MSTQPNTQVPILHVPEGWKENNILQKQGDERFIKDTEEQINNAESEEMRNYLISAFQQWKIANGRE